MCRQHHQQHLGCLAVSVLPSANPIVLPEHSWLAHICKGTKSMRFQFLTVVLLRAQVFCDVMLGHWISGFQHVKGSYCLHLYGQAVREEWLFHPEQEDTTFLQDIRNHSPNNISVRAAKTYVFGVTSAYASIKHNTTNQRESIKILQTY